MLASIGFFLVFLGLGAWIGAISMLSFIVAPLLFSALGRQPPPEFLDKLFRRYYALCEIFAGAFLLGALALLLSLGFGLLSNWRFLLPLAIGAAGAGAAEYARSVLTPAINAARGKDQPRFDSLHKLSVRLNAATLFALLFALWLMAGSQMGFVAESFSREAAAALRAMRF